MPEEKATSTRSNVSKGDSYECGVCGVVVTVDECGDDYSPIMCCRAVYQKGKRSSNDVTERGPIANEAHLTVEFTNFLL